MIALNYSEADATILSYPLVAGTALYNFFLLMFRRHPTKNTSLVDYNIVMILIPSVLYGSTIGTILFASLSGYVFARHRFPGKEIIYTAILALLMIPPILTLIPAYVLILELGLQNTYWALILPWTSGGQVFALLLFRSFLSK